MHVKYILYPGSYKLWKNHLEFLLDNFSPHQKWYKRIMSAFERSLVRLHKMPRIWMLYLSFVREHDFTQNITFLRRLHDRALVALPITQHEHIWKLYVEWIVPKNDDDNNSNKWSHIPSETVLRVLRRYLQFSPIYQETFVDICVQLKQWGEAASTLQKLLNETNFVSAGGKSKYELWMELANICTKHPEETYKAGVNFELIVRAVLKECQEANDSKKNKSNNQSSQAEQNDKIIGFGEIEGALWCKLADYHVRNGEFELARSVFEEALESAVTMRDFGLVFDAYANFEEGTVAAMMEMMNDEDFADLMGDDDKQEGEDDNLEQDKDLDILLYKEEIDKNDTAIELSIARAERLMERRPLLLNMVLLRQNPNNIGEWLRRSELYLKKSSSGPNISLATDALEEAIKKVNPRKAINGNPSQIWITLATIHEEHISVESARNVFDRVCLCGSVEDVEGYNFKHVDDLAQVYTAYVETELRHDNFDEALSLTRQAISDPSKRQTKGVYKQLHKSSLRIWNLALDLEESLSDSIPQTRATYERCIYLKVATPAIILNFATFLNQNNFFEDSFSAYEKGLDLFKAPHLASTMIWKTYLEKFIERYKDTKIIRTRELFERCLKERHEPPTSISQFYLLYASFEQKHAAGPSLTKRLLRIYERHCIAVPLEQKLMAYQLYILKASSLLGMHSTRPIYEAAISACNDKDSSILCTEYAHMEIELGEVVRARAAFTYGAQLVDPRRDPKEYWKKWSDFEVSYGNEDTFREMLRVKRSVTAAFSTVNYNSAEIGNGAEVSTNNTDSVVGADGILNEEEALEMLERREGIQTKVLPTIGGFVSGTKRSMGESGIGLEEVERRAERLRRRVGDNNNADGAQDDEEIDIDDDDNEEEEEEEEEEVKELQTKSVPSAVFGGLAAAAAAK